MSTSIKRANLLAFSKYISKSGNKELENAKFLFLTAGYMIKGHLVNKENLCHPNDDNFKYITKEPRRKTNNALKYFPYLKENDDLIALENVEFYIKDCENPIFTKDVFYLYANDIIGFTTDYNIV